MVKTKTPLDQTWLNAVKKTPYLDIESEVEPDTKAGVLKAKAVVMIDPLTGRALGASDFFLTQQPDATLTVATPVSTTLYEVLPTTLNVKIIASEVHLTWAVTQPTPLEMVVTVDGKTITYIQANPVTATGYFPRINIIGADTGQTMTTTEGAVTQLAAEQMSGKSVRIQIRVTWAVTQPTNLICRVKFAKR